MNSYTMNVAQCGMHIFRALLPDGTTRAHAIKVATDAKKRYPEPEFRVTLYESHTTTEDILR
jgi:hypothetical protein